MKLDKLNYTVFFPISFHLGPMSTAAQEQDAYLCLKNIYATGQKQSAVEKAAIF